MNFWETFTYVGTQATIWGIFLTAYAIINNKTLKKESGLTREMIKEMREALAEESRLTREMIKETTEYLAKYLGGLKEGLAEESKLTREMIKETTEYLAKYLGDLIVATKR